MAIQERDNQSKRAYTADERFALVTGIIGEVFTVESVIGAIEFLINEQLLAAFSTLVIGGLLSQMLAQSSFAFLESSRNDSRFRKFWI